MIDTAETILLPFQGLMGKHFASFVRISVHHMSQ